MIETLPLAAQTSREQVLDSLLHWHTYLAEGDNVVDTVFRTEEIMIAQQTLVERLEEEGRYDLAIEVYDSVINLLSTRTEQGRGGRINLGLDRTRFQLLKHLPATAHDSLLALEPLCKDADRWAWMLRHAEVLSQLDSADHALALYDSLFTIVPDTILWEVNANRGYLLTHMGHHSEAIASMERALTYIPAGYTRDSLIVLSNLALCYALAGQHDRALTHINTSLRGFERGTSDYAVTLRKQAEILWWAGKKSRSAQAFKEYVATECDLLSEQWPSLTLKRRQDYWGTKRPLLNEAFTVADEQGTTEWLFDFALRRRVYSSQWAGRPQGSPLQGGDTAVGLRKSLKKGEVAIDFVRFTGLDSISRYIAFLATRNGLHYVPLWTEQELHDRPIGGTTLKEAVCSTSVQEKNLIYQDSLLLQQLWQPLLPYIKGAKDVWFAPDGLLHMLAIEQVDMPGVTFHRKASSPIPISQEGVTNGEELPLLAIGGLDYNTLPDAPAENSGGDLPLITHSPIERGIGDEAAVSLLYDALDGGSFYFPYLPQTRAEVDALDTLLPHTLVLHEMSEEDFKQRFATPAQPTLLHLATHGYSLAVDVNEQSLFKRDELTEDHSLLASALVFSGANEAYRYADRDDGLLTARELSQLDLSGCPLVVLSACQSGLGTVSDEGSAGLVRALKQAGAGSIVATLWEVSDASTALFMKHFYSHLVEGKPLRQAFDSAQDELRQLTRDEHPLVRSFSTAALATRWLADTNRTVTTTPYIDPYFWAAFILIEGN